MIRFADRDHSLTLSLINLFLAYIKTHEAEVKMAETGTPAFPLGWTNSLAGGTHFP